MAKRCPSCGYAPIGPFTDNCPMCAEPVRNVRSERPRSSPIGGLPPVVKWIIGGAILVVVVIVALCGLGMWRMGKAMQNFQQDMVKEAERMKAEREADQKARMVVVSAADLLQEFEKDRDAADRKYLGKYLEITGVVERSGRGRYEQPFVILHGGDENAKLKVECFFVMWEPKDEARLKRIRPGDTVTVRGEYDGRISNVQLQESVLVKSP